MQHTLHIINFFTAPMHVFKGMKTGLIIIYCQKWWPGKRGMQPMWVQLLLEQHSEEAQLRWTQSLVWEGRQLYHGELCEWLWLTCAVNLYLYLYLYLCEWLWLTCAVNLCLYLCEWLWLTCAVNAAHNASSEALESRQVSSCSSQRHLSQEALSSFLLVQQTHTN